MSENQIMLSQIQLGLISMLPTKNLGIMAFVFLTISLETTAQLCALFQLAKKVRLVIIVNKRFCIPATFNENNPHKIRLFSLAPRPGLEPGTISLHMIHNFRNGVDYLISPKGIRVYSLYTFITCVNLARDCQFKGFPELARFFISHFCVKLPYSTGSRSTIELPRNIVNTDKRNFITANTLFQATFSLIYICESLINIVVSRQAIISRFSSLVPSCNIYFA